MRQDGKTRGFALSHAVRTENPVGLGSHTSSGRKISWVCAPASSTKFHRSFRDGRKTKTDLIEACPAVTPSRVYFAAPGGDGHVVEGGLVDEGDGGGECGEEESVILSPSRKYPGM